MYQSIFFIESKIINKYLIKYYLCENCEFIQTEEAGWYNSEFTISGDYEMWLRMQVLGATFHKTEDKLGVYYHNPEGMSTNPANHANILRQDAEIGDTYGRFLNTIK